MQDKEKEDSVGDYRSTIKKSCFWCQITVLVAIILAKVFRS